MVCWIPEAAQIVGERLGREEIRAFGSRDVCFLQ
jgi:hypothetical protein